MSIYKERAIDLDDLIGISHGDCPGEALRLETKLREAGHRGPILLVPHERWASKPKSNKIRWA